MDDLDLLIEGCLRKDPSAFDHFYRRYAGKMFAVCLRFAGNPMEAEDLLQEGFIRVFENLSCFRREGSFEGWVRRTFVTTAINHYKKQLKFRNEVALEDDLPVHAQQTDPLSRLSVHELMEMIRCLPLGYRTVFVLFAIEGYSHREISSMLGISENTSKSQLSRARMSLQKVLLRVRD